MAPKRTRTVMAGHSSRIARSVSVRLDANTERLLARLSQTHRVPQSEIVRRAIRRFAEKDAAAEEIDVYGRVKHLIGQRVAGGRRDEEQ